MGLNPAEPTAQFSRSDGRALGSVALQFFVNGAIFASFAPRLPEIRDRVGLSIGGIGLLLSIAGALGLIGSATAGPVIERLGTRRSMLWGGIVLTAALAVIGVATSPWVLLLGLGLLSVVDVLVDVAMNMQGSWLSARRHAPVMNRLHGLWSLGTVVGGMVAFALASAGVGISAHVVGAAVVLFFVVIFVSRNVLAIDEKHDSEVASASQPSRRTSQLIILLFGMIGLFAFTVEQVSGNWAAFRFTDDFGRSAAFGAVGFVASTAGMTLGRFAGDWATARFGAARLLNWSTVAAGIGLAMASFWPEPYGSLFGYALAGVGIAPMFPLLYDLAIRYPGRSGASIGAMTAGMRVGSLAIPFVIGALANSSLSVGSATAIVTLPCALGFYLANARIASAVGLRTDPTG